MNTYYKNSIDYHNDLDCYEARVRAEQEETEIYLNERVLQNLDDKANQYYDYDRGPDYPCDAEIELLAEIEADGSDTSAMTQLNDAGFGSGGVQ